MYAIRSYYDFQFDNERFGYTPAKASKLSRSQQMLLHAAYQAVENAKLLTDDNRIATKVQNRTAVVVATCLGNELASDLHFKYFFPEVKHYLRNTPEFNALSEPEHRITSYNVCYTKLLRRKATHLRRCIKIFNPHIL